MIETVPKNFRCINCNNEQYRFDGGCVLCEKSDFELIQSEINGGDFVLFGGETWIVIDSYNGYVRLMNGYKESLSNVNANSVSLVAKGIERGSRQ